MDPPETQYARSGDVHIAYQVVGEGPFDLALLWGAYSHVEHQWDHPASARFLERLASFSRLIVMDGRGTGLSDRAEELPILEQQMDDLSAVLDAAGSKRAALLGLLQGGPLMILAAATHPERTSALVLYSTYARISRAVDYPFGRPPEWIDEIVERIEKTWGRGEGAFLPLLAPSMVGDEAFAQWWSKLERISGSPGAIQAYIRMQFGIDVRHVLPTITMPTLVLQRRDDRYRDPRNTRYLAEHIPGARYVELEGRDQLPYVGDPDAVVDEIEEFLTGARHAPEPDRVLATVMFTDIVGSTETAAALGDRRWRALLESHNELLRRQLTRFRGREISTAGDSFLATFDGPARAIRCGRAISEGMGALGIEVRTGLHTGEIELAGEEVHGIAVHIGARVAALAAPGEILVSRTVKDLVAGSGIEFEDRGEHLLKGVPGEWSLHAVKG